MNKKALVLHVLSSRTYNGAENVVCQIVSMFKNDDNFSFAYCSLDGPVRKAIEGRNILFRPVSKLTVNQLKKVIRELKPDIIHAHDMKASFIASLACGNIPLVSHIHNNNFDSRSLSIKSFLYYHAAKKAKHIFWVSKSSLDGYHYSQKLLDKSSILFNVIDIDDLTIKADSDFNNYSYDIVYLGRLTYQKNPQRLINVMQSALTINPHLQFAILGAGEDEDSIKEKIGGFHLEHSIHMLGFMDNPYKVLKQAKALLLTSRWEGTPMCALESLALGTPLISTPVDGMVDLIKDNEVGFMSNDDFELASFCAKIVSEASLHEKLSKNSQLFARNVMDIKKYKMVVEKVYQSCLKND